GAFFEDRYFRFRPRRRISRLGGGDLDSGAVAPAATSELAGGGGHFAGAGRVGARPAETARAGRFNPLEVPTFHGIVPLSGRKKVHRSPRTAVRGLRTITRPPSRRRPRPLRDVRPRAALVRD